MNILLVIFFTKAQMMKFVHILVCKYTGVKVANELMV